MVSIRQILALGMLLLLAGSHRLWTPQTLYPRVPLLEYLTELTPAVVSAITWSALSVAIGCCLFLAMPDKQTKRLHAFNSLWTALLVLSLLALVCLDQHRMQPWAIHIALCFLLLDQRREQDSLDVLFWLTASIYIYSAISKFDAQFLHTVGQEFLHALGQLVHLDTNRWPESWRVGSVMLFPLVELLCGIGIIFRPARNLFAIFAVGMHLTLIAILGPWGLDHSWGVLLWNLLFIALNLRMISYRPLRQPHDDHRDSSLRPSHTGTAQVLLRRIIFSVAIVVPMGERWGWTDHWLGWALYAPHSSRAIVRVPEQAVERLPNSVQKFVGPPEVDQLGWCELHLDNWSLATLGVPIYPQERFYVAVAEAATRDLEEFEVQTLLLGVADRWTGRRAIRTLPRRSELVEQTHRYWINAVAQ